MAQEEREEDCQVETLRCPAEQPIRELLSNLLPGDSAAAREFRSQVLEFVTDLSARAVLLQGPIGIGKSSLARVISFAKRIAPLEEEVAIKQIKDLRFEGPAMIETLQMPWYVELPLTGLVESLADAQLFGTTKGAFTDASEREGIFELAATGRDASRTPGGAEVTGGVVFLDEIGDLADSLQAKLLPVLAGGVFYRLGGEGDKHFQRTYDGIVISATWREPIGDRVRPDLLSRLSPYAITLPSISVRDEDLPALLDVIQGQVLRRKEESIQRILTAGPGVHKGFYNQLRKDARTLTEADIEAICAADWSVMGELRGLSQVVERILVGGQPVTQVLNAATQRRLAISQDPNASRTLVDFLEDRAADGRGVAAHVRDFETQNRAAFRDHVFARPDVLKGLAEQLGMEESRFREQLRQLARSRRGSSEEAGPQ